VLAGLLLVLPGAGCGGLGNIAGIDASDPSAAAQYAFPDDADPVLAQRPFVETELLVQPYPGADAEALALAYAQASATVVARLDEVDLEVLSVTAGELGAVAAALDATGLIEGLHKNYVFTAEGLPDDPLYARQWHLDRIGAREAWETTTGSRAVKVAVVDSGIDTTHPDLTGRVAGGWNVYNDNADYEDVYGHGTMVAGIIAAATRNATGVAGVTWDCPLLVVRASDELGQATARHLAAGILWSAGQGAKVINVSFAPLQSNRLVRTAAQAASRQGALVVISAGNFGQAGTAAGYPEALFVGALDNADALASFSDSGPFIGLVAPGTGIYSTDWGATYRAASGTSFAAPIVAGVAALGWSINPDLRPSTVAALLTDHAVDLGTPGVDNTFGAGRVDAAAVVAAAVYAEDEADTTPPTVRIASPTAGARISGRVQVSITAADDSGVADVVLLVDGLPYATDTRAPYRLVLEPTRFAAGAHVLTARATDWAGHATVSTGVTVTFARGSGASTASTTGIVFDSPAAGATVRGNVTIQATLRDADGLATVEWLIDGTSKSVGAVSGTSAGVSYLWRSAGSARGEHVVTLVVMDATGAQTTGRLTLTIP